MIKVICISYSFSEGGAAIAARNFSSFLKTDQSIEPILISQDKNDRFQFGKRLISYALQKLQYDGNPIKHCLNFFSYSPALKTFEAYKDGIFHFNWINNDTLSIFDFNKIPPYSIITLHDEWFYCGSEHYYNVNDRNLDFVTGYQFFKKGLVGINWNYLIWKIKFSKLSKRKDLIFTVPSTWMGERASGSLILKNSDIRLLPNPIDTTIFAPSSPSEVSDYKSSLNLQNDDIIIAFGAIGGAKNSAKGVVFLKDALKLLQQELPSSTINRIKVLIFGGKKENKILKSEFDEISLGFISEPRKLALIYSACDFIVVPSIVESFGQVAAEALACETPVVCFNSSGLKDIVLDLETGILVKEFSSKFLSEKLIQMIFLSSNERKLLGKRGRQHVLNNFSIPVISKKYLELLKETQIKKFGLGQ